MDRCLQKLQEAQTDSVSVSCTVPVATVALRFHS
jgi:hypothetical protein